jgi:putative addiction module killer protein
MILLKKTREFDEWFSSLTNREQKQVAARLERIQNLSHFGDAKSLGDGLCELRWNNGWRVYFIKEAATGIILLLGGHKNEQKKDIGKARFLFERYTKL